MDKNEYAAAYYQRNKEKIKAQRRARYARDRLRAASTECARQSFTVDSDGQRDVNAYAAAYYQANKEKIKARRRARYAEDPERENARGRLYNAEHKAELHEAGRRRRATPEGRAAACATIARRRLRPGGQELTPAMILEVMAAASGVCVYCGQDFENGHVDHITPVSKGGTNDRENLVYVCASCNWSKGAKTLDEWLGINRTCVL